MNNEENIFQTFNAVVDHLRGVLPTDVVAETPALLFCLKRFTDLAAKGGKSAFSVSHHKFVSAFREFSWIQLLKTDDAGEAILSMLSQFEQLLPELNGLSNQSKLAVSLRHNRNLGKQLVKIFSLISSVRLDVLSPAEAIVVFQRLLESTAGRAANSITPHSVRKLLVGVLSPQGGSSIYDPVCASASLLCDAAQAIPSGGHPPHLFGQESEPSLALLARMNALLGGWEANVQDGDTLVKPKHLEGKQLQKFDYVLANPPFGRRLQPNQIENDSFDRFQPAPLSSELAFVQHINSSLLEKGRGVVLVPNGVLFRSGNDYEIRKHLVESDRIQAILSLPRHLFHGTPIAVSVLVLDAAKSGNMQNRILFVDLNEHAEGPKTRRHLSEQGILETIRCVKNPSSTSISAFVDHKQIVANEYDLTVSRYVRHKQNSETKSYGEEVELFVSAIKAREIAESKAMRLLRSFQKRRSSVAN